MVCVGSMHSIPSPGTSTAWDQKEKTTYLYVKAGLPPFIYSILISWVPIYIYISLGSHPESKIWLNQDFVSHSTVLSNVGSVTVPTLQMKKQRRRRWLETLIDLPEATQQGGGDPLGLNFKFVWEQNPLTLINRRTFPLQLLRWGPRRSSELAQDCSSHGQWP